MGQVFKLKLRNRGERELLLAICDHARDDGTGARPGVRLLSHKTDLSTRQVERHLKSLRDQRIIIPRSGGGHGRAVEYFIDLSKAEIKPAFCKESAATQMAADTNHSSDISRTIRRHSEPNQTTFPAHSSATQMAAQPSVEPSIEAPHTTSERVCSRYSWQERLEYSKAQDNIRRPEALATSLQDGHADDSIREFFESRKTAPGETKEEKERRLFMALRGPTGKRGLAAEREMKKIGLNHS
jgi:hypothetical protein